MTLYYITPDEKIRQLRQEIGTLKAELATARARIAELEAALAAATEWEPVPDGEILNSNGLHIEADISGGWLLRFDKNGPSIWFPDTVHLCRHLAGAKDGAQS